MPEPVAARRTAPRSRRATAAAAEERQFGRGTPHRRDRPAALPLHRQGRNDPGGSRGGAPGAAAPARPGRGAGDAGKRAAPRPEESEPERHIHFDDGREPAVFEEKSYGKRPKPGDKPAPKSHSAGPAKPGRSFGDKPRGATRAGPGARPAARFRRAPGAQFRRQAAALALCRRRRPSRPRLQRQGTRAPELWRQAAHPAPDRHRPASGTRRRCRPSGAALYRQAA